jgi:hypothetical protein
MQKATVGGILALVGSILGALFGLVLLALPLGWLYRRGAWGKAASCLLLAGFVAGNASHTLWLYKVGRGHCAEAIQYLATNADSDTVVVSGDNDLRISSLLAFYAPRTAVSKRIVYWNWDDLKAEPADWLILHRQLYEPTREYMPDDQGRVYKLETSFEMMSPRHPLCLSGWSLYLYRLTNMKYIPPPPP